MPPSCLCSLRISLSLDDLLRILWDLVKKVVTRQILDRIDRHAVRPPRVILIQRELIWHYDTKGAGSSCHAFEIV